MCLRLYVSTARSYIVIKMFEDLIDRIGVSREAVWSSDHLLTRALKSVSSF